MNPVDKEMEQYQWADTADQYRDKDHFRTMAITACRRAEKRDGILLDTENMEVSDYNRRNARTGRISPVWVATAKVRMVI